MTAQKSLSVKGIAIILMIVHHLFTWGNAEYISLTGAIMPNSLTIEGFFGVFGKLCVTLYLFLSGYGFSSKYVSALSISKSKVLLSIWKVYKKYLLVLIVFLPYGFLNHIYSCDAKTLLQNVTGFNTSYNQECWFLFVYILIVLIILPQLIKTQNKVDTKYIAAFSLFLIVLGYGIRFVVMHSAYAWIKDTRVFFNLYYFLLSQFAFVSGWLCKRWEIFEKTEKIRMHWSIGFVAMAIVMVVKVYCPGGMLIDTILTPVFIALCLKATERFSKIEKYLRLIGKYSTYMWLTHTFFAFYYWPNLIYGFKYPILIFFSLLAVSLIASVLLELTEKILNTIMKNIIGNIARH